MPNSKFKADVHLWVTKLRADIHGMVGRMMFEAQTYAMSISPIWSGDFGSNWNVSIGAPDTSFHSTRVGKAYGNPKEYLWGRGNFNISNIDLSQPVTNYYLSNSATHTEPYAWAIEEGAIVFRDWNVENNRGGAVARKTGRMLAEKYGTITKGMLV